MAISQKKKKTLIAGIICALFLLVVAFFLGRISVKDKSPKPKNNLPSDSQEIQQLKNELSSVKNELNHSNTNQKIQLENKLNEIENEIKILANQDKSTIQELAQEIKEIREKLKDNSPDNPEPVPGDRKEGKFDYVVLLKEEDGIDYHVFRYIVEGVNRQDWRVIYINKKHPEIKRLLGEGKLEKNKKFTILYGKADKEEQNLWLFFNEFNTELEITEA